MKNANGNYDPKPEHKFSYGLWTVGNRGQDPFGDFVRPVMPPEDILAMLAEVGAWGVNLHDNDLIPIDATPAEQGKIVSDFKKACKQHKIVVPMMTVSLFFHPRVSRWRIHRKRPRGPRLRDPENNARDGCRC